MSASPPKQPDVEVGEQNNQSPDEQEDMESRGQQESSSNQPAFDFEVKEQDRWLPIANGMCIFPSLFCCSLYSYPQALPLLFFRRYLLRCALWGIPEEYTGLQECAQCFVSKSRPETAGTTSAADALHRYLHAFSALGCALPSVQRCTLQYGQPLDGLATSGVPLEPQLGSGQRMFKLQELDPRRVFVLRISRGKNYAQ